MSLGPCPECDAEVSSSASVCPSCGADLRTGKWKISDKISLFSALIALVAVLGAGVGGYFTYEQLKVATGNFNVAVRQLELATNQFNMAYQQYRSNEQWKQQEFIAGQIKDFYADPINSNVLKLLDYDPATIDLLPDRKDPAKNQRQVPMATFVNAIRNDNSVGDVLLLRQQFEHFLANLSRFNYLANHSVINPDELCNVMGYHLALLAGDPVQAAAKKNQSKIDIVPLATAMREYVQNWQRRDIYEFFKLMSSTCGFQMPFLDKVEWKQ